MTEEKKLDTNTHNGLFRPTEKLRVGDIVRLGKHGRYHFAEISGIDKAHIAAIRPQSTGVHDADFNLYYTISRGGNPAVRFPYPKMLAAADILEVLKPDVNEFTYQPRLMQRPEGLVEGELKQPVRTMTDAELDLIYNRVDVQFAKLCNLLAESCDELGNTLRATAALQRDIISIQKK